MRGQRRGTRGARAATGARAGAKAGAAKRSRVARAAGNGGVGGGKDAERLRGGAARLSELGSVIDLAAIASDDSGVMRLRLVAALVTQVIHLLQALVVAIMRKRRKAGKSAGAPSTNQQEERIKAAGEELRKGGMSDGLISRTTVYDVATGHTFAVYEIGRWGSDPSRIEVLGRGATLQDAVSEWRRGQARSVRRRWGGHGC